MVELLVVIAIVGVLAGILIPTVGMVRNSAAASRCTSNLRQVFNLYMLDVQSNRGMLPPAAPSVWIDNIAGKYFQAEGKGMGQALGCPIQIRLKDPRLTEVSNNNSRAPRTYSINRDLNRSSASPFSVIPRSVSSIASPARTALAADGNDTDRHPDYYTGIIGSGGRPPEKPHSGKANVLFFDGHVRAMNDSTLLNAPTPAPNTPQATFWFGE